FTDAGLACGLTPEKVQRVMEGAERAGSARPEDPPLNDDDDSAGGAGVTVATGTGAHGRNGGAPPRVSQADLLIEVASAAELFTTPSAGDVYATIPVGEHRETWSLRSQGFRRWLQHRFHEAHRKAPSAQAMEDALGVLAGNAQFASGQQCPVF